MKWNNFTYQSKMKLLPIVLVLVFLLVYSLTVSNTIDLSKQVKQLENQVEKLGDAPLQVQILKKRLEEIEERIGNHSGTITQEDIFDELSIYCKRNGLTMREFPVPHEVSKDDYKLQTHQVELEGSFKNLLKLLYFLEQETYLGKVAATKFLLKEDKRIREEYLSLTIFLQTVR
ncbi:hypothetical protein DF185_22665 [Marinifilum breve]|uniref:Uncharacterized protein n=1 Tax=Marinifilum breve TaxID=2184082 RepID=A0A2V3ZTN2_9BACT|nr:hypothetical protein [Marinifilum breve]PXX95184.1 hypothetical protein DF185_22665 [Marinifilum breve]